MDGETWEEGFAQAAQPPNAAPRRAPADAATYERWSLRSRYAIAWGRVRPNPGLTLHRLNRTEYANAIRDLLTLEVDVGELLPADDAGYGFDNIDFLLSFSPVLMEAICPRHRRSAAAPSAIRTASPVFANYELPRFLIQNDRMGEDLPLGSRGGVGGR